MADYYTGTWLEDDGEEGYIEHHVKWARYKASQTEPEEWILMEVDGDEEHRCDKDKWAAAEKAFGDTALKYAG